MSKDQTNHGGANSEGNSDEAKERGKETNADVHRDGPYAFESRQFPGVYLRMDGRDVRQFEGNGSGIVNAQFTAGSWEYFYIRRQERGTVAIESAAFPNVFLRMDGRDVVAHVDDGAGVVNCQASAGPYELFRIREEEDDVVTLESAEFPGVYLRLDGTGVTSKSDDGGGTVNCQFEAGPWERFRKIRRTHNSE
ncbi:MAG TPA: hypothetical protein VFN10_03100 [Thermoanaerobaculia bacterium]|nr:hypothetical protein [Thermoanaerobaculia bacterium]